MVDNSRTLGDCSTNRRAEDSAIRIVGPYRVRSGEEGHE
jgi:hypothetical protein